MSHLSDVHVIFCPGYLNEQVGRFQRFRKSLFIDQRGWDLTCENDREYDQFDRRDTRYCLIVRGDDVVGGFRAIRTDHPYLAREIFPQLANERPFPKRPDMWEISRFGVLDGDAALRLGQLNYGLMFYFARAHRAVGLVALADLPYERFLRTMGIPTIRYGPPQIIGHTRSGRPLRCVAGEIPLATLHERSIAPFLSAVNNVRILDDYVILGHESLSA